MDVLLTLAILTIPVVISALQTCSSGTETSSTQIMLEMSPALINAGGWMCSCRLTVSQLTRVDMFPGVSWSSQCDTYMTIQKWGTSTQCKVDGVVRPPPGQTHDVTTGEEIWILVVATTSGARGLSGQLQFKVKQPGTLSIECFEPNTNSSTTPTQTSTTTTTEATSMKTTSTRPSVRTETPSATSTTVSTPQKQTVDTSTSSSAGVTSGSAATPAERTQAPTPTKDAKTYNTTGTFPGGIFAGGVATGVVLVLIAGGLYVVISRRHWWTCRRQKPDDIPISEAHPTYSGLKSRTEETINTYDIIDPKLSKGTDNPYINVS